MKRNHILNIQTTIFRRSRPSAGFFIAENNPFTNLFYLTVLNNCFATGLYSITYESVILLLVKPEKTM